MKPIIDQIKERPWLAWLIFTVTMVVVFVVGMIVSSVVERRTEAVFAYAPANDLAEWEARNEEWGKYFKREYQSFARTADTLFRSKYNGSATIDMLEVDPRLVVLWAGYGFAKDYNQGRGHAYAVSDLHESLRTGGPLEKGAGPMPSTCWTCKSPDVPRLMSEMGVEEFYRGKWFDKGNQVVNAIGCADCHDPKTMNLRISRPALAEAFDRMGKDISLASHQEMRSLVCAQCHSEYYFKGESKYLTFPWDKGLGAEAMEEYYDSYAFTDWTHALSRAPMLKAQHPGYELYTTGIHYQRGVSCADCHMPYHSEGGMKFTDHHIRSPLSNVANSCQVCHRQSESELLKNVYERQDKIIENRDKLEELLVRAHVEAKKAWDLGAGEESMKDVLTKIRHAQWRWDYAAASHGGSFHSPIETSRIIGTGIDKAQEARLELSRILASLGHNEAIPYPDISTKAKAQAFIGLDMEKLNREKQVFMEEIVPEWLMEAREKGLLSAGTEE